ncbi:MAG: phenylalanine--tRNA ligase subunit beta, partial [Candidatus Aenigmarchaeota archaeon]|nr:phenylalanine--tRNA ligase subunit beta [Candidatus Aenigmarchaeota archaeon]MDI6722146.1 phenylalanine--tRNA ligase subunit beta [Candidatus Aenigmarchaeota archaeon]
MPTIEISRKFLEKLCGRRITEKDFEVVKGEASFSGDTVTLELGDTNRPDLWSAEGVARALKGYFGMTKERLNISKSSKKIVVDKKLRNVRPFIAGFSALNIKVTEDLLIDTIQLQEKIGENYGRKRQKIAIGIYDANKMKFP